jgi:hypothetical protein
MRSNVPKSTDVPAFVLAVVLLALSAASAGNSAVADDTGATCGSEAVKASGAPCGRVATSQKSAILRVPSDDKVGVALEVTARPISGENSPPYLVGVFVDGSGPPKLLGSFSFYPARVGVAQTFVLPNPDRGSSGQGLTLSVKLIPANPARDIKDAAVEVLGARIVGE